MPTTSTLRELVMAAHFQAPLNVTLVDIANWIAAFSDEFPTVEQHQVSPPVTLGSPPIVQLNLMPIGGLPRIVLRSPTTNLLVQLQADRVAFGWGRSEPLGDPSEYPGYETMKASWRNILEKFHTWHEHQVGSLPNIRLVELAYHNAVPSQVEGRQRRLSEMFRFVQPGRTVNMFQVLWGENLSQATDSARVTAHVAIGTALPDQQVFAFNFTGLAPAEGLATAPEAFASMDALHERILDMRNAAIILDEVS